MNDERNEYEQWPGNGELLINQDTREVVEPAVLRSYAEAGPMRRIYLQVRFAMLLLMAVLCYVFWIWPTEAYWSLRGK